MLLYTNSNLAAQSIKSEAKIKAIFEVQKKAWNSGDIPSFMETYWKSPRLVFLGSSGPIYGWQNTLERYYKKYPDRQAMGHLEFDISKLDRRSKKVYSVIGHYHLTRSGMENLEGYFMIIVKKIKGKWLIVADSTF